MKPYLLGLNIFQSGKQVQTTLLGNVTGIRRDGKVVGYIPYYLNVEAEYHGFRVIGASVQDGTYTLEKL